MGIEQAKYPGQRVIFTEKVDHETEVIAEHVNALQNEVQAIEQFIGLQSDLPAIPGTPASTNSIASRLKGLLDLVSTKASIVHSHAGEYAAPQHTHTAGEVSGIPSVPVLASGSSVARIGGYSTLSIPLPAGRFSSPPTVVFSNGDYNAAPYHLALVDGTVTTTGFVVVAVPAMPNSIAHAAALAEWVAKHPLQQHLAHPQSPGEDGQGRRPPACVLLLHRRTPAHPHSHHWQARHQVPQSG